MARPGLPARRSGPGYRRPEELCDIPGCDRPAYRVFHYYDEATGEPTSEALRACSGHFRRIERHGDPLPHLPLPERRNDA
jgi:hypothetical protein